MISKAIRRAYATMHARGWDTIYWAIDLHGVCLRSNYEDNKHEFISQEVIDVLTLISDRPESKIILWSSVYATDKARVIALFARHGIKVHGFNENPYEGNTSTGCFDQKFYFSVLLDDKAGFDHGSDWALVRRTLESL